MSTRFGSLAILAQGADRRPGLRRLRWMQPRDGGQEAVRRALAYLGRYRREAVGAVLALLLVAARGGPGGWSRRAQRGARHPAAADGDGPAGAVPVRRDRRREHRLRPAGRLAGA